jgi:hypothetical protein
MGLIDPVLRKQCGHLIRVIGIAAALRSTGVLNCDARRLDDVADDGATRRGFGPE